MNPIQILKRRREVAQAYKDVFDSPQGQIVLEHLAKINHVYGTTFVRGDQYETALNEGGRRVVLSIMKYVGVDAQKIISMIEEQDHANG